jgi:hypothetical protein
MWGTRVRVETIPRPSKLGRGTRILLFQVSKTKSFDFAQDRLWGTQRSWFPQPKRKKRV